MPLDHQPLHLLDGIQRAAPRPVGILLRLQVRLEDRLQDEQCRRLHDTILDRWNPQRSLLAVCFRNVHPTDGLRTIRLLSEFLRHFTQPLLHTVRFDVRERLAVHARRAVVDATTPIGVLQHIRAIHLVVQQVEAVHGRALRFGMQRLLQLPNLRWRLQAHANLPAVATADVDLEPGSLPSTGITRLRRYYGPLRLLRQPDLSLAGVRLVTHPLTEVSRVASVLPVQTCHRHYPGGMVAGIKLLPGQRPRRPSPTDSWVGSRVKSFEACSAFTRVMACLARGTALRYFPSKASAVSLPPPPLRLLLAGATVARWESHPLKNDALTRRTVSSFFGHPRPLWPPLTTPAPHDSGRNPPRLGVSPLPTPAWPIPAHQTQRGRGARRRRA